MNRPEDRALTLHRAFLDGFWAAVPTAEDPLLSSTLEQIYLDATQTWPALNVPPELFAAHLGCRLEHDSPLGPQLEGIAAADLYLACACTQGDSRAIALLEQTYAVEIRTAISRVRHKHLQSDDFRQILRHRLFVGRPDRAAAIARYGGQGALGVWIRVTALRTAINAARDERDVDGGGGDDELFDFKTTHDDPELDYLKRTYRDAFRQAFHETLAGLAPRERGLLRQSVIHGLTVRELAGVYDVHHATVARWLAAARQQLLLGTRTLLKRTLGVETGELNSIMYLIQSNLDASIARVLDDD